jgi:mycothiol synthase
VPPDVVVRTPNDEDAEAIAKACNELSERLYGVADLSADEVRHWLSLPDLDTAVAELDGEVCGYTDFRRRGDGPLAVDLRVGPQAWGRGVADALVRAAESSAPGSVVHCFVADRDEDSHAALEGRGYRVIRQSFDMQIDLEGQPEPPEWPPGLRVRTYEEGDERAVYECQQDAFSDHWEFRPEPIESWRRSALERPGFDPTLWRLVEADGELAGFSLNNWHSSGDETFGWVGSLGVRNQWRRLGLGLALLRHSFVDFARRGATRVGLTVDAENTTGAVRLYERAGMHQVRRMDIYEGTA